MIVCSQCHHQNPDGATQCEACFSELSSLPSCANCGSHNLQSAMFCSHCGAALLSSQPEQALIAAGILPQNLLVLEEGLKFTDHSKSHPAQETCAQATLVHQETQIKIQLDRYASPIHLGKATPKVTPDIDLSSFRHAELVSRTHADIVITDGRFYLQDKNSANGTFLNYRRIQSGTPHVLSSGDRISLGQGDLVSFIFELS
ncbi:MAG: FHA domain-containing protein [Cyanobacteria bacterium P01_F01_bin.42]